ncbi:hypothetical protein [Mycobacterium aquaticum]|uniref:Uncharacterized protein n=1 Tax=Mycobacterium aquaticum TaxID=1927124 RepID=A0A1X0AGX4_9MYCO|nr:hypothetical protein [Mycobacterium aquaticum]ORA29317.1 hypothetical protein BST13_27440 [Mycobacterium aquaticum]
MPTGSGPFIEQLAETLAHHWWIYAAFTVAAVCAAIGRAPRVFLFTMALLTALVAVQIAALGSEFVDEISADASSVLINN